MKKDNKLIAKFMNHKYLISLDDRYKESWDWLMPVVEKIEDYDIVAEFVISQPTIMIIGSSEDESFEDIEVEVLNKTKLDAVYEAVIEFIKLYNKI